MIKKLFLALTIVLIAPSPAWVQPLWLGYGLSEADQKDIAFFANNKLSRC